MHLRATAIIFLCCFTGLLVCLLTAAQGGWKPLRAQSNEPALTIPAELWARPATTITLPIHFQPNGSEVSATTFSIDFDPTCLSFDPADQNGDMRIDAVRFQLPPQLSGSVAFDPLQSDSELDVTIADFSFPFATLPATEPLMMIEFSVDCTPTATETLTSTVRFSNAPPPSFSDPFGRDLSGVVSDGVVLIALNPPTATPTAIATLTATPTFTPKLTPTTNPTLATPTATALLTSTLTPDVTPGTATATPNATPSNPALMAAQANMIYVGADIKVLIDFQAASAPEAIEMVVILDTAPSHLFLQGVSGQFPYSSVESLIDLNNRLLTEGCPGNAVCRTVRCIFFQADGSYVVATITATQTLTRIYVPLLLATLE